LYSQDVRRKRRKMEDGRCMMYDGRWKMEEGRGEMYDV
jgi:hypothetical protein